MMPKGRFSSNLAEGNVVLGQGGLRRNTWELCPCTGSLMSLPEWMFLKIMIIVKLKMKSRLVLFFDGETGKTQAGARAARTAG